MAPQTIIPTLHHLTSSQSHRILFMLEELHEAHGLDYHLHIYHRNNPTELSALRAVSPLGKSPVLTLDGPGAPSPFPQLPHHPALLAESRLILEWLHDTYGQGMYDPTNAADHRQDLFFREFAKATLAIKVLLTLAFEMTPAVAAVAGPVVAHWKKDLVPIYDLMEATLSEERPWFAGEQFGLADFNMIWGADVARARGYYDRERYPKVEGWYQRVVGRPAWKRAVEKGGAYNLVTFE
ncbi:putative glutathione S-transferase [Eremomyces bilateralis CBS 781.70]|uniref:Glutathione S-transferase n=1 Tax=Eremomyces bilateralis CBS 781.70 TaxID=1392243 RepID=A0A6G1G769_9PEZI|nr:putative glutathione S-transferase [Eremomyces bilateralis CBS 781.70]KAF1813776.1 putative glutathione S-transferase [Eremomyces bilateralis CBS 781.70]